ncbi:MAG: MMPL family transporter [Firmicutes bacterium]|nr:MMPL family transporter [Bacillota bacterium]
MRRLTKLVLRYPQATLIILTALTIAFASFLPHLSMKTDTKSFIPKDDPVITELEEATDEFGSLDMMMVVLRGDIFTPGTLAKIQRLSDAIRDLHGVEEVTSPLDVSLIRGSDLGIEISPAAPDLPQTQKEISDFRDNLLSTKQGRSMVTPNGQAAAIMITLEPGVIGSRRAESLAGEIENLANKERGPEEIYTVGEGYMGYYANKSMSRDLNTLFPLAVFLVLLTLYLSFWRLSHVGIILLTVIMSIIWTVGLMAATGYHLTIISVIMPVILVAMCSAVGIHIISRFEDCRRADPSLTPTQAAYQIMTSLNSPILMTALTTAAGFASLVTSFVVPVREFGVFSALGIMFGMVISITCIPAYLVIRRPRPSTAPGISGEVSWGQARSNAAIQGKTQEEIHEGISTGGNSVNVNGKHSPLMAFLSWSAHLATTRPRVIVIAAAACLAVFAAGIPRIAIETNILQYFREDSPVVRGTKIVEKDFGGTSRLSVIVDAGKPDGVKDPQALRGLVEFEKKMNGIDKLSDATSVADLVMQINQAFHGDRSEYYTIPDNREAIAQELLLFTMQGGSGLDSMVSYDFQKALVSARVANVSTSVLSTIIDRLTALAQGEFTRDEFKGSNIKTVVVGIPKVAVRLMQRFISSQLQSLFWSMLAVWVIVSLIMASAIRGALCLIPLVLTVIINFGFMGYVGAALDVTTMMISGICIGIGIDYAIHLISRYWEELMAGRAKHAALVTAVTSTGRGIFYNAVTLAIGFGILVFSSFRATAIFGSLLAGTMLISSMGALIVLPAVLQLISEDYFVRSRKPGSSFAKGLFARVRATPILSGRR